MCHSGAVRRRVVWRGDGGAGNAARDSGWDSGSEATVGPAAQVSVGDQVVVGVEVDRERDLDGRVGGWARGHGLQGEWKLPDLELEAAVDTSLDAPAVQVGLGLQQEACLEDCLGSPSVVSASSLDAVSNGFADLELAEHGISPADVPVVSGSSESAANLNAPFKLQGGTSSGGLAKALAAIDSVGDCFKDWQAEDVSTANSSRLFSSSALEEMRDAAKDERNEGALGTRPTDRDQQVGPHDSAARVGNKLRHHSATFTVPNGKKRRVAIADSESESDPPALAEYAASEPTADDDDGSSSIGSSTAGALSSPSPSDFGERTPSIQTSFQSRFDSGDHHDAAVAVLRSHEWCVQEIESLDEIWAAEDMVLSGLDEEDTQVEPAAITAPRCLDNMSELPRPGSRLGHDERFPYLTIVDYEVHEHNVAPTPWVCVADDGSKHPPPLTACQPIWRPGPYGAVQGAFVVPAASNAAAAASPTNVEPTACESLLPQVLVQSRGLPDALTALGQVDDRDACAWWVQEQCPELQLAQRHAAALPR